MEVRAGHRMQTADAVRLGALTLSSAGCCLVYLGVRTWGRLEALENLH